VYGSEFRVYGLGAWCNVYLGFFGREASGHNAVQESKRRVLSLRDLGFRGQGLGFKI
jgi:hypothetical protein